MKIDLVGMRFGSLTVLKRVPKGTRIYRIWKGMVSRCNCKGQSSYKHYGGRGISVCSEWLNYIPFDKWASENGYSDNLTIDRIDVNGNYEPSNCRWIPMEDQAKNKRNSCVP